MIGDDLRSVLPFLQREAESRMVTPCKITRAGDPVLDEDTGNFTDGTEVVFDGFCEIQTRETQVREGDSGSSAIITQLYLVKVPVASGPYQDKDIVTVPGRTFRVEGLHLKTWQTAQRLPVVEVI